jgi:outer membrane protein, multidrug efflux system
MSSDSNRDAPVRARRVGLRLWALLILVTASAPPLSATPRPMGLDAIEAYALEHSPLLALASLGHAVAEAEYLRASKAWVPSLETLVGGGYMPGQEVGEDGRLRSNFDEPGYIFSAEVQTTLPIFTFGKLRALEEMGEQGRALASAKASVLRQELLFQVRSLVAALRFLDEAADIAKEGRRHFDKASRKLDAMEEDDDEDYEQIDHFKLRIYEADIVRMELEIDRKRVDAREGLAALIGLPGPEALVLEAGTLSLEEDREGQAVDINDAEAWVARLDAGGAELKVLDAEHGIQEGRATLERRRWWPDLGIVGEAKYQKADPVDNVYKGTTIYDPYNKWYAGAVLGLTWSFDVVGRLSATRKHRALAAIKKTRRQLYREKLALEVRALIRELHDLRRMVQVTKRAQKAARSWLVDRSNLYDSGFVPAKEVMEPLKEFYKRKTGHLQAILDFNRGVYKLRKLVALE